MKLRNKKTREIGWLYCDHISIPKKMTVFSEDKDLSANHWDYKSLAELNEEWEDYHKEYWHITWCGDVVKETDDNTSADKDCKVIGNYFETKEDAEKAVEKLKAWKRLKDKGFRFDGYDVAHNSNGDLCGQLFYNAGDYCIEDVEKDLDLLFSGEDD